MKQIRKNLRKDLGINNFLPYMFFIVLTLIIFFALAYYQGLYTQGSCPSEKYYVGDFDETSSQITLNYFKAEYPSEDDMNFYASIEQLKNRGVNIEIFPYSCIKQKSEFMIKKFPSLVIEKDGVKTVYTGKQTSGFYKALIGSK